MSNKQIIKVLEEHFVPYKVVNNRILADSRIGGTELFEEVFDCTGISREDLFSWLGY